MHRTCSVQALVTGRDRLALALLGVAAAAKLYAILLVPLALVDARAIGGFEMRDEHGVDAKIIAEGVETEGQLAAMRSLGIQLGQGYHLGRPGSMEQVVSLAGAVGSA